MAAPVRIKFLANFSSKMFLTRVIQPWEVIYRSRYISTNIGAVSKPQSESPAESTDAEVEEFRVYEIPGLKRVERVARKKARRRPVLPPRYLQMPIDQDWTKVWPAAASFKYSVVPFPVRQGFIKNNDENEGIIPGKYANAELMKIPNFLHLTPAHIKKHCAALQKFCTKWPENLNSENLAEHFPVKVTTYSYCHSGPSIRHPKARVVKMSFKLGELGLDYHARDKFIRLVGDRYNEKTDMVTIEADRCPVKIQNYDYIQYLMTALYYESQKTEPWEAQKEESDWERYYWDKSLSKRNMLHILKLNKLADDSTEVLKAMKSNSSDDEITSIPDVQQFREAVCEMNDEGEDEVTIRKYKESVLRLYGLRKF